MVSSIGFLRTPAISPVLANTVPREPLIAEPRGGPAAVMGGVAMAAWPGRRR
jgi:hypothetical protein